MMDRYTKGLCDRAKRVAFLKSAVVLPIHTDANRNSTFETHESIMMIMNEAKAYLAQGRVGLGSGHKSMPKASASSTNWARS
jgi:hypothetical protein